MLDDHSATRTGKSHAEVPPGLSRVRPPSKSRGVVEAGSCDLSGQNREKSSFDGLRMVSRLDDCSIPNWFLCKEVGCRKWRC